MTTDRLPTLETDRLRLRPFTLDDADAVQRLAGHAAVADTTLNIPHPYSRSMAESWIGTHPAEFAEGRGVTLALTLRENGELVGAMNLMRNPRFENAEIGYWIGHSHWNHGYATEALEAFLRHAFETLNLHRVFGRHVLRNPASGRVMQKVGMQMEGTLREHSKKGARFEDMVFYGILRAEWTG